MAKGLSAAKAKKILTDGYVKGKPLTAKQKKYFGAIASGATPLKAIDGTDVPKAQVGKIIKWGKELYDTARGIDKITDVAKVSKKFESSIDWAKWNKAIPENKALIKEYNAIEETTKKNGTWMKNPDGSAFNGTPEQFVQENSENFKKAFPNGFDTTTRGDRVHYESMNQGVTFSGDKQVALNYTYGNAQPFTRNSPLGENPNPVGPGIVDSEGLYELYYPKKNNTLKIDGKGNDYSDIPVEDEGLIDYMKGKQVWTDDIAKYIKSKNIDRAIIDNIYDDSFSPGQVIINNNKPGNYLKSIWGNDGMFDMTNPNIYKAIVPGAIGAGAVSQMGPKQEDGQFKNGGWLDKYQTGGSLSGASGMMYGRTSGNTPMEPGKLKKAQTGINNIKPTVDQSIVPTIVPSFEKFLFNTRDEGGVNQIKTKNLQTQFDQFNIAAGGSCVAGALNCNTGYITPSLPDLVPVRTMIANAEKQNPNLLEKYKVKDRNNTANQFIPNNSIDAWEIHQLLRGEGLGTAFFTASDNTEWNGQLPKDLDLTTIPLGAIIGQGTSEGTYTKSEDNEEGQPKRNRHGLTVVGHDFDGMPMVYDSGSLQRLDFLDSLVKDTHKITRITVPKGYEKYTYKYMNDQNTKKIKDLGYKESSTTLQGDVSLNSDWEPIQQIEKAANYYSPTIALDYGVPKDTMEMFVKLLPGISAKETKLNNRDGFSPEVTASDNAIVDAFKFIPKIGENLIDTQLRPLKILSNIISGNSNRTFKNLTQTEIDAFKEFNGDLSKVRESVNSQKEINDSIPKETMGLDELSQTFDSSVGAFRIKDFPEYVTDRFGIKKSDLFGTSVTNEQEFKKGTAAALSYLAEKYQEAKRLYKDKNLTEEQLVDLAIVGYNSQTNFKNPEFVDYYIKNRNLKNNYLERVKEYNYTDERIVDGVKYPDWESFREARIEKEKGVNKQNKIAQLQNVPKSKNGISLTEGWLDKYEESSSLPKAQNGIKEAISKYLGDPYEEAREFAENPNELSNIDNMRHAQATRLTQEAIANKTGNIPLISNTLGFLGSNALGVGHELSTLFGNKDKRDMSTKLLESGEDIFNNLFGSIIGTLPISDKTKDDIIRSASYNNMLPDGYVRGEQGKEDGLSENVYFKNEDNEIKRPEYKNGGWLDKYEDGRDVEKAQWGKLVKWGKELYNSYKGVDAVTDAVKIYKKPFIPTGYPRGSSSSVTSSFENFKHGSNSPDLTIGNINLTEKYNLGTRPKRGRRIKSDVIAGMSDPLNLPGGFYNSSAKKIGFGHPRAELSPYIYNWKLPKGSRVLELPGGTSTISIGDLQKYRDEGYDMIKGADITGVPEYLPLNKNSMVDFNVLPNLSNQKVGRTPLGKPASVVEDVVNVPDKIVEQHIKMFDQRTTPIRGGKQFDDGVAEYNSLQSMYNVNPERVVQPFAPVTDVDGNIIGYNMENLRGFSELSDWKKTNQVTQSMKDEMISTIKDFNSKGLYHGDLKSNNIMVDASGNWKIIDPVGYKHADNMTSEMLEEAKKLDMQSIKDIQGYKHGGSVPKAQNGEFGGVNTDINTTSGEAVEYEDFVYPELGDIDIHQGELDEVVITGRTQNKIDRDRQELFKDMPKFLRTDLDPNYTITAEEQKQLDDLGITDLASYNKHFGTSYSEDNRFNEFNYLNSYKPKADDMRSSIHAATNEAAQNVAALGSMFIPGVSAYRAALPSTLKGLSYIANSPIGRATSKYALKPIQKVLNYKPMGGPASIGNMMDIGFADMALRDTPGMYDAFKENPNWDTGIDLALTASDLIPYGEIATGFKGTRRLINSAANKFNDLTSLKPNFTPFERVVEDEAGRLKNLFNQPDIYPTSSPLPERMEPYLSQREIPISKEEELLQSTFDWNDPEKLKHYNDELESRLIRYNQKGEVIPNSTPIENLPSNNTNVPSLPEGWERYNSSPYLLDKYKSINDVPLKERTDIINAYWGGPVEEVIPEIKKLGQESKDRMAEIRRLREKSKDLGIPDAYDDEIKKIIEIEDESYGRYDLLIDMADGEALGHVSGKPFIQHNSEYLSNSFISPFKNNTDRSIDTYPTWWNTKKHGPRKPFNKLFEPNLSKIDYGNMFKDYMQNRNGGSLSKYNNGGVIKDDMGQWAHPGKITEISGNTMATHGYGDNPLYVVPDVGEPRVVEANTGTQTFPGATKFTEYPMAQNGDNVVKDFMSNYINSPKFKERLTSSNYNDVEGQVTKRSNNIDNTNYIEQNRELSLLERLNKRAYDQPYSTQGSKYDERLNTIIYDDPQALEYGIDKNSIIAHEYGHAALDTTPKVGDVPSSPDERFLLNDYDTNELTSRLRKYKGQTKHDLKATENKSDLDAFRFELFQQGVYDAGKEDITKDLLKKGKDSFIKKRLLKNYKEKDLIWLMNNIASIDNSRSDLSMMAKNGSSLVELNQLTNFTNYNTPQPGGWLDKYN